MGMVATQTPWTVDRLQAIPDDGNRYEIVDGTLLVTPAPSAVHQSAVLGLTVRLAAYLRAQAVGALFMAPGDVPFDDRTLVQPDLFVTPLRNGKRPTSWNEAGRPLLAVEVISPSSASYDRVVKRRLYQRQGVPEYWVVDTDARLIERWRPAVAGPEILTERVTWCPEGASAPFMLNLADYWAEVFG